MVRDVLSRLGKGLNCTNSSTGDWGLNFTLVSSSPFLSPPPLTLTYPPRKAWKNISNSMWRLAHSTDGETLIYGTAWHMQLTDCSPRHSFQRFSWAFTLGTIFTHPHPHLLTHSLFQKVYLWAYGIPGTRHNAGGMGLIVLLVVALCSSVDMPVEWLWKEKKVREWKCRGQ